MNELKKYKLTKKINMKAQIAQNKENLFMSTNSVEQWICVQNC